MSEINLLSVPIILPPSSEANSTSTSLVPVSRLTAANQIVPRSDTAYPNDNFVWSVSPGDNGSFHFYAVPLKNFLNGGTTSQDGFQSAQVFRSGWSALNMKAVAQYQLLASMPMPMYGHMLSVYA
jgi:hypothetical protein